MNRAALILTILSVFALQAKGTVLFEHVDASDPISENWILGGSSGTTGPVYNDLGLGLDAWNIAGSSRTYHQIITPEHISQGNSMG